MKKGFTLVELMAVIIIIAIISTISFLAISYSIERTKERLYLEQVHRLESSLRKWSVSDLQSLPIDKDGISFFSIERLVAEGIINNSDVVDPRTDEKMDGCIVVTYNNSYSQYEFNYTESSCGSAEESYKPTIVIEGGTNQTVEVNEVYVLKDVKAFDYLGKELKVVGPIITNSAGDVLKNIDTSILSPVSQTHDYVLTYKTVDTNLNLEREISINLKVVDTTRPIIEVLGSNRRPSMVFEAHPVFTIPPATTLDNSCGKSMDDPSVNSCSSTVFNYSVASTIVNPRIPGNYTITYTSVDYYGNSRTLILDVEIEDTTPPTVPTFNLRLNNSSGAIYNGNWTNQNVWLGNLDSEDLGTGVKHFEYTLNCGSANPTWVEIVGSSVTFTSTQNSSLCVRAEDYAGNVSEHSVPRNIRIDKINPTCNAVGGSDLWFNTDRTITGTCSDNDSGCVEPLVVSETYTTNRDGHYSPGQVCDAAGNCVNCQNQRVRIDKTNPAISCSPGSAEWTNQNVAVTVSVSDALSGLDTARSRISSNNGSSWGSWTSRAGNFTQTFSSNGTHRVQIEATDRAGNFRSLDCGPYRVDKTAPTATFSPNSQTSWGNSNVSVTISASDTGGSGYRRMRTRTSTNDGSSYGSWSSYSTSSSVTRSLSGTGQHRIQVEVEDNAGNTNILTSGVYRIDQTTPTAPTISGASSSWTNGNRTVTISGGSASPSGVNRYQYRTRPAGGSWGSWTNYSSSLSYTSNTNIEIQGRIVDNAGNTGTASSTAFVRIDKTLPTITLTPSSQSSWGNSDVVVTISVTDSGGSGYNRMRNRVSSNDGSTYGSWSSYSTSSSVTRTLSSSGQNRIQVEAEDHAGNTRTITSSRFNIDKNTPTAPTISGASSSWTNGNRTISISGGSASPSGINRYQYRTRLAGGTWGSWTNYSSSITYSTSMNREIQARIVDNAGNTGTATSTAYVRIDKVAPTITYSPNSNSTWSTSHSTTLSGNPGASGTNTFRYIWNSSSTPVASSITYNHTSGTTRTYNSAIQGTRYLWARLCDNAGNCTMTSSGGFRIDNTAPTISAMTCSYHTVSQVFRVNFNASSLSGIARYSARFDNVTRSSTTSSTLSWNIPSSSAPAGSVTVREIQIRNNTGLETNTSMVCTVTHFSN